MRGASGPVDSICWTSANSKRRLALTLSTKHASDSRILILWPRGPEISSLGHASLAASKDESARRCPP